MPAARDLLAGSLIPKSTPSNAHPPLVMAWLALAWKVFGERVLVTRVAMLLIAAFSLVGLFRLALAVSNFSVATCATILTAIYPVFFAQSSLAHVDLAAAGLTLWALDAYVRNRTFGAALWFCLAALAKETAILAPLALALWGMVRFIFLRACDRGQALRISSWTGSAVEENIGPPLKQAAWILGLPVSALTVWYCFHHARTGFFLGNPEFLRYNAQETLHPLRIFLALLLRLWQIFAYMNLYVLTIACGLAMWFAPIRDGNRTRERISIAVQLEFLAIIVVYLIALSVLGGAVLARYMLPVVPLVILICVSTIWRRLPSWKLALGIVAGAFAAGLFVNPPYGFAPEDNLAYRDYVQLHENGEAWLLARYPNARVLTAWPASGELTKPYLGYVQRPMHIVQIENFTAEQLLSAAEMPPQYDVALVFSTKYQVHSVFDGWAQWQEWKSRYFGYHRDLPPQAAAQVLGGKVVYVERRQGQWIGVIQMERIQEAEMR